MKAQVTLHHVLLLLGGVHVASVSADHQHLRHRHLADDTCPPVSFVGVFCPATKEPVLCVSTCEYDNVCFSVAAGFLESSCESLPVPPVVDPEPPVVEPQGCPENLLLPCSAASNPVVCAGDCVYNNFCEAIGAGKFDCDTIPDDVVTPTEACPVINFIQACTDQPAAVVCGPDSCEYDALCTAEAAGFVAEDCFLVDTCPQIEGLVACPLILDPIKCGEEECEYDNSCLAAATGAYDVETECKSVFDIPEPEPGVCPVTGPAFSCLNVPDPVICGPYACEYGNPCLATGAGFDEIQCASVEQKECPVGNTGTVPCEDFFDPVICGNICEYDNLCSAQTTGFFTEEDCISTLVEECPVPELTEPCPEIFQPVECGETFCFYDNLCFAEAASFLEEDCAILPTEEEEEEEEEEDAPTEDTCPETDPDLACITLFDPVVCGEASCEYSNECFASGAGFASDQCQPAAPSTPTCPESDPDLACITLFDPVACGPAACEYSNECFAVAAGFMSGNCQPVEEEIIACPLPANVPCILLFAPVICEGCEYSNQCVADAAGFSEEVCAAEPLP